MTETKIYIINSDKGWKAFLIEVKNGVWGPTIEGTWQKTKDLARTAVLWSMNK